MPQKRKISECYACSIHLVAIRFAVRLAIRRSIRLPIPYSISFRSRRSRIQCRPIFVTGHDKLQSLRDGRQHRILFSADEPVTPDAITLAPA